MWAKEYAYLGNKLVAMVENVSDVAPGVPSGITVPASSDTGSYTVSWEAASGTITRYELQEATDSAFTMPSLAYSGPNLSASITGKVNGTYYTGCGRVTGRHTTLTQRRQMGSA